MNAPPIYLDDCSYRKLLVNFLRRHRYIARTPDAVHLEYAARHGYVLLTKNTDDFSDLHDIWQARGRKHAGIWLIYEERNRSKNMSLADIVRAIGNLLASGLPIAKSYFFPLISFDQTFLFERKVWLHTLNYWR
jgi:hypothetical protein